jgi:hypothetical protein
MLFSSFSKNIVLWDKASRIFMVSSLSFRVFIFSVTLSISFIVSSLLELDKLSRFSGLFDKFLTSLFGSDSFSSPLFS